MIFVNDGRNKNKIQEEATLRGGFSISAFD